MRVTDQVKNGVSNRVGEGFHPVPPLSFFGSRSISCLAKTENPVRQSFFAPKTNGNAS